MDLTQKSGDLERAIIGLDVRKEKLPVGPIFAKKTVVEWGDVEIRVCSLVSFLGRGDREKRNRQ